MERFLVPLVLFGNGITAGVMFSTVIGLVPWTMAMPYDRYVQTIRFLWPRYDPFMPIANVVTLIADLILTFTLPGGVPRVLFGAASLLLVIVMTISLVKNVPINKYVTSLDPDSQPPGWRERDPRARWRNWNLIRTLLILSALAVNAAAAASLIQT